MRNEHSVTPRSLRLGILGLALTTSFFSIGNVFAENQPTQTPAKMADASSELMNDAPDAMLDPLDRIAAARKPEGRATVNNIEATLEAAYRNNSDLKELQAATRSKDDTVPQALAGWRPTVYLNASINGEKDVFSGDKKTNGDEGITIPQSGANFSTASTDVTLNQNLYNGGKTVAQTCQAESSVLAARALLADKEREVLYNAVQAYFNVIAKTSELEYKRANENALKKTLEGTQDKFNVGEETRTSIAQAQADLAAGTAERESAEAQLLAAEATFEQVTGARPGKLKKPQEPASLPRGLKEAVEIAKKNNPAILAALYQERAARSEIKANDADLLPRVDLQGTVQRSATSTRYQFVNPPASDKTQDLQTTQRVSVNLKVPLYEPGTIRGKTRELREIAEQKRIMIETKRREIIQKLVEAWETYLAAKANVHSYETQVKSNEVALEGTRQEMMVGSKILLDVLNAQRLLVSSQLNLVRAEQNYYQSAYNVLALMGRLNALDLKLKVKRYNPEVHYRDVRNTW